MLASLRMIKMKLFVQQKLLLQVKPWVHSDFWHDYVRKHYVLLGIEILDSQKKYSIPKYQRSWYRYCVSRVLVLVNTGKGMACIPDQCIHNYININSYTEINL